MKRFGFKFIPLDAYLSKAIDIRFGAIVLALICGTIASIIIGDEAAILSFMPFAFIYVILGFGVEFYRKTFVTIIVIAAITICTICLVVIFRSNSFKVGYFYGVLLLVFYHGSVCAIALKCLRDRS